MLSPKVTPGEIAVRQQDPRGHLFKVIMSLIKNNWAIVAIMDIDVNRTEGFLSEPI